MIRRVQLVEREVKAKKFNKLGGLSRYGGTLHDFMKYVNQPIGKRATPVYEFSSSS